MKQQHYEGKIRDNLIWDETSEEWIWNGASEERIKTSEKTKLWIAGFTFFILPAIICQALITIGINYTTSALIGVAIGAIITFELIQDPNNPLI